MMTQRLLRTFAVAGAAACAAPLASCAELDLLEDPGAVDPATSAETQDLTMVPFTLRVVCSPWLYLKEVTGSVRSKWKNQDKWEIDIASVNNRLCQAAAASVTASANRTFGQASGVPARFSYTYVVAPGGGAVNIGVRLPGDSFSPTSNPRRFDRLNSIYHFPDVTMNEVDVRRRVDTSTCSPFLPPPVNPVDECTWPVAATCADVNGTKVCRNRAGGTIFDEVSPYLEAWGARSYPDSLTDLRSRYPNDARTINVAVRLTQSPDGSRGMAIGVYDRSSQVLAHALLNSVSFNPLSPNAYLPTLGHVVVQADADTFVAAHELGHVFGALHSRPEMQDTLFYATANLSLKYQFAHMLAGGAYHKDNTIMSPYTSAIALWNFSTDLRPYNPYKPPMMLGVAAAPSSPGSLGDALTDNRRYVIETVRYITGDQTLVGATPVYCNRVDLIANPSWNYCRGD